MTPEQTAWIREHIWPPHMRHNLPSRPEVCSCTWGPCDACQHDMHADCITGDGRPAYDVTRGHILNQHGRIVAPVIHLPRQRPCRLWCPCLHHSHPRPQIHRATPVGEQLGLFTGAAS